MGKKNLRRNRPAAAKAANDPISDPEFLVCNFIEWMDSELSTHYENADYSNGVGPVIVGLVAYFRSNEDRKRRIIGLLYLITNSLCRDYIFLFTKLCHEKVMHSVDQGRISLAKSWLLVFSIFMHVNEAAGANEYLRIMDDREEILLAQINSIMRSGDRIRRWPMLFKCFDYGKSYTSLRKWLLTTSIDYVGPNKRYLCNTISSKRIAIKTVWLVDQSTGYEREMHINKRIRLKTLLMLVLGGLQTSPKEYTLLHEDESGNRKGKLLVQSSGDKILIALGFEHNDCLYIVDASASLPTKKPTPAAAEQTNPNQRKKEQKPTETKTEKKAKQPNSSRSTKHIKRRQVLYETNDINQDKVNHSKLLTLVFEEASQLFQERRQRLNELVLKKTEPKERRQSSVLASDLCAEVPIPIEPAHQVSSIDGIHIVSVPYWEWRKLDNDRSKRQKYLQHALGLEPLDTRP